MNSKSRKLIDAQLSKWKQEIDRLMSNHVFIKRIIYKTRILPWDIKEYFLTSGDIIGLNYAFEIQKTYEYTCKIIEENDFDDNNVTAHLLEKSLKIFDGFMSKKREFIEFILEALEGHLSDKDYAALKKICDDHQPRMFI